MTMFPALENYLEGRWDMKKVILAAIAALLLTVSTAAVAFADPPSEACNGLDAAHEQIHGSGTQGELTLHELRADNHCGH